MTTTLSMSDLKKNIKDSYEVIDIKYSANRSIDGDIYRVLKIYRLVNTVRLHAHFNGKYSKPDISKALGRLFKEGIVEKQIVPGIKCYNWIIDINL